jgi:holo-[acyl-carrier protein] synthase
MAGARASGGRVIVGVGLDLVDIARVKRLIASKEQRALDRLFTAGEVRYAMSRMEPYVHLAARIAAKEAAYKALSVSPGARGIGWREMEVVSVDGGLPELLLHGTAQVRCTELAVTRVWLTLSHSQKTAGAMVILEGGE